MKLLVIFGLFIHFHSGLSHSQYPSTLKERLSIATPTGVCPQGWSHGTEPHYATDVFYNRYVRHPEYVCFKVLDGATSLVEAVSRCAQEGAELTQLPYLHAVPKDSMALRVVWFNALKIPGFGKLEVQKVSTNGYKMDTLFNSEIEDITFYYNQWKDNEGLIYIPHPEYAKYGVISIPYGSKFIGQGVPIQPLCKKTAQQVYYRSSENIRDIAEIVKSLKLQQK